MKTAAAESALRLAVLLNGLKATLRNRSRVSCQGEGCLFVATHGLEKSHAPVLGEDLTVRFVDDPAGRISGRVPVQRWEVRRF